MFRSRTWFHIHSWLGIITGLLLFVLCWTGSFATVAHEIDWLLTPSARVGTNSPMLPLSTLHENVSQQFPQYAIRYLQSPMIAGMAAQAVVDTPVQKFARILLNPYTAEVLDTSSYFSVQRFFRSLHISLFNGQFGLWLVWCLAIPLTISFISPLIFYKRWWQRFFVLKTKRGKRILWSDIHKLLGLWSLWFLLIITLTSLWFLFEAVRGELVDGKYSWAGTDHSAVNVLSVPKPAGAKLSVPELLEVAQQIRPDITIKTLIPDNNGLFYIDGQTEHLLVRDRANKLLLDSYTGNTVYSQNIAEVPIYWRISDTADPLHFGNFAGLISKLIWFVFGLALSALCLTGVWLHAQRLQQNVHRFRWTGSRAVLIGTSLILVLAILGGYNETKRFGAIINDIQQWPKIPISLTLFIAVWAIGTLAIVSWWGKLLYSARITKPGQQKALL